MQASCGEGARRLHGRPHCRPPWRRGLPIRSSRGARAGMAFATRTSCAGHASPVRVFDRDEGCRWSSGPISRPSARARARRRCRGIGRRPGDEGAPERLSRSAAHRPRHPRPRWQAPSRFRAPGHAEASRSVPVRRPQTSNDAVSPSNVSGAEFWGSSRAAVGVVDGESGSCMSRLRIAARSCVPPTRWRSSVVARDSAPTPNEFVYSSLDDHAVLAQILAQAASRLPNYRCGRAQVLTSL